MRVLAAGLALVTLLALAPAAPASHACAPTTSQPTLRLGTGAGDSATLYVVLDEPTQDDAFVPLPWIYAESNGHDGLQRHDDWRDDTCRGEYTGDLLLF